MLEMLLRTVARDVRRTKNPRENLFTGWQSLLGFNIGWAQPSYVDMLSGLHALRSDTFEIVMLQVHGLSEAHVHERGAGYLMILGEEDGFQDPRGGVLSAYYSKDRDGYLLDREYYYAGQELVIEPDEIHAAFADPGTEMTAVGIVSPRIRNGDTFDIIHFDFISRNDPVLVTPRT